MRCLGFGMLLIWVLTVPSVGSAQRQAPGGYTAEAPSTPDGETIYFSLASLCEAPPPVEADTPESAKLIPALHEDDWRQIEFVPTTNQSLVERMVSFLSELKRQSSVGPGFSKLYIRQEFPRPLSGLGLTVSDLRSALPSAHFIPAFRIATSGTTAQVKDGFALSLSGIGWVYGYAESGEVQAVGLIVDQSTKKPSADSLEELSAFARSRKLALVDWYRPSVVPESILAWLSTWKQVPSP